MQHLHLIFRYTEVTKTSAVGKTISHWSPKHEGWGVEGGILTHILCFSNLDREFKATSRAKFDVSRKFGVDEMKRISSQFHSGSMSHGLYQGNMSLS